MKGNKHIQSFNENVENLNISDVSDSYDFENFLNKFAENNFGFDPDGNPA